MMVSAENDPRRAGTIWVLNLDEATPIVTPRLPTEFRRITPDLVPALSAIRGYDASAEFLQRFETGRHCYGAWVEGQPAAFGWVSYDDEQIGELNLRIKLLPGEVYIWDCATAPHFRGNGLYSALLSYILGELRNQQTCRAWIGADHDNVPSQKGIERAGFHHIAYLIIERVLAIRQVWLVGLPDVPESIVNEARRAFLNDRDKVWVKLTIVDKTGC
jgi:ribosomal protein S18 acetylase RimI-like enzyme